MTRAGASNAYFRVRSFMSLPSRAGAAIHSGHLRGRVVQRRLQPVLRLAVGGEVAVRERPLPVEDLRVALTRLPADATGAVDAGEPGLVVTAVAE